LLNADAMRLPTLLFAVAACSASTSPHNGFGDDPPDAGSGSQTTPPTADAGSDTHPTADASAKPDAPPPPPIEVLRGVDRASAFAMSEASTLKSSYGVKWTGVYIGGPCDAGSGWTKALVASFASELGWTFMPIYVGQQTSSICGRSTVTAAQGTSDGSAAVALMKTFGWQANNKIPVCLDLEAGTYGAEPTSAVAYAKAWRDAVHASEYLAYIYSNPDGINGLASAGVTFDGAWPASWFYTGFANVAPSDLSQLGASYDSKNRAWQYAGAFAVTGAGSVDGDTSDLLLAPAPDGTNL
jgi:hypothetical protein